MSNNEMFSKIEDILKETVDILPKALRNIKINQILDIEPNEITYEQLVKMKGNLEWALRNEVSLAYSGSETTKNKIMEIYATSKKTLRKFTSNSKLWHACINFIAI